MAVTKEFAVTVDTELADIYDRLYTINYKIDDLQDSIRFATKYNQNASNYIERIAKLEAEKKPLLLRRSNLMEVYKQDPWTRAFLVINSNGHVHSSMECSTCFDTTRYNWLVQYSNDDEATIVSDAGETACTVCYPSAPAEVLNRPSTIVTADKVAKAQAKAERDAKREARIAKEKANAPTKSGEFLAIKDGRYTQYIKTERTAVSEFKSYYSRSQDKIVTHYYNGTPHTAESIAEQQMRRDNQKEICKMIATALAGKHNVSFDEMWSKLTKKVK